MRGYSLSHERKLYTMVNMNIDEMLKSGKSVDDIMAEIRKVALEADTRLKKEAEAKSSEAKAQRLVELSNRAMDNKLTAEDVAYIQQLYIEQKYPQYAVTLTEMFSADSVENAFQMAIDTLTALNPLIKLAGAESWDDIISSLSKQELKEAHKASAKCVSDDDVLRSFAKAFRK